jgi:hypothetical protein
MWKPTYQILKEYQQLVAILEEDEVTDELMKYLTINKNEAEEKIEDFITLRGYYSGEIDKVTEEIKRLSVVKDKYENADKRLKSQLIEVIKAYGDVTKSGSTNLKAGNYSLTVSKSVSTEISTMEYLPKKFLNYAISVDGELYEKIQKEFKVEGKASADKVMIKKAFTNKEYEYIEGVSFPENDKLLIK